MRADAFAVTGAGEPTLRKLVMPADAPSRCPAERSQILPRELIGSSIAPSQMPLCDRPVATSRHGRPHAALWLSVDWSLRLHIALKCRVCGGPTALQCAGRGEHQRRMTQLRD